MTIISANKHVKDETINARARVSLSRIEMFLVYSYV